MTQITITLNKIKAHNPCSEGWGAILSGRGKTEPDDEEFPLSEALQSNSLGDVLWALRCLPEHDRLWRKLAVWCARQVQHLMTDPRSLAALDVAWRHSEGDATDEELRAAWVAASDAARASSVDAWSESADVWSARDVASAAARASASDAARAAASWATSKAAWAAQKAKMIQILDAGEWVE